MSLSNPTRVAPRAGVTPPARVRAAAAALPRPSIRLAWQTATLGVLVLGAWLVYAWALVARHRAFNSRAYDLGYFDQVIWNTAHGRWFETNFVTFNFLGEHVEPVLLVFAALYRVWPSVEALLVIQAAFVAGAAVPLYLAARRTLASATAALIVAAAFLLAPAAHRAVLFDFHPEMLGVPAIFAAYALLVAGRPTAAAVALGALFLLKEDAVLVCAGFAWLFWLRGERRHALGLAGVAVVYAVVVMGWLMPSLRGDAPGLVTLRYGYLGDSPGEMVVNAIRHPLRVLEHLAGGEQRRGVGTLLAGLALLPLASPAALIAAPVLALNLLSTHNPQQGLELHYGIYPLALLLVAAVDGAARLARARRAARLWDWAHVPASGRTAVLAGALLLASAAGWATSSPLGGRFEADGYRRGAHADAIERVLARIPAEAPLSAQSNLVPHLSQRRFIRDFPRIDHAEYVVIDFGSWGIWETSFETYDRVVRELPSLGFCRIAEDDGVQLWRRGGECAARP